VEIVTVVVVLLIGRGNGGLVGVVVVGRSIDVHRVLWVRVILFLLDLQRRLLRRRWRRKER
jgi:hypothetical protein